MYKIPHTTHLHSERLKRNKMFLQIAFQGHYFYGQDVSVSVGTYNMLLDYFIERLLGSAQYFQC